MAKLLGEKVIQKIENSGLVLLRPCDGGMVSSKSKTWSRDGNESTRVRSRRTHELIDPKTPRQRRLFNDTVNEVPIEPFYASNHVLINKERTLRGLSGLMRSTKLDDEARRHARTMAEKGATFVFANEKAKDFCETHAIEIAQNVASGSSMKDLHSKCLNSKGLKQNMLDDFFVEMGVGVASDSNDRMYLCQMFMRPLSAPS